MVIQNKPLVSICIPVYNAGEYLYPAVSSVLNQCFTDFELIIVDDCSTVATETVLAGYDDPRMRFYRNTRNLGLVGNWNRCIELTQGEYITIFHQDDVMHPDKLSRQIAMLKVRPTIGFVYTNFNRIDKTGKVIGGHWLPGLPQPTEDTIEPGEAIFEAVAAYGNIVSCPTVIFRRECYERLGAFDPRLPFATDLEMWLRIATYYDVGYLIEPLVSQRVHPDQETAKFANTGRDYLDILHALNIVFSRALPHTYMRYASRTYQTLGSQALGMAKWMFQQGRVVNGLRYMFVASMALLHAQIKKK